MALLANNMADRIRVKLLQLQANDPTLRVPIIMGLAIAAFSCLKAWMEMRREYVVLSDLILYGADVTQQLAGAAAIKQWQLLQAPDVDDDLQNALFGAVRNLSQEMQNFPNEMAHWMLCASDNEAEKAGSLLRSALDYMEKKSQDLDLEWVHMLMQSLSSIEGKTRTLRLRQRS